MARKRASDDDVLAAATDLAVAGGFDRVKQRDVAAKAGVALATLYKKFRSKEHLLTAAMSRRTAALEARLADAPIKGATPEKRLAAFFHLVTREMTDQPRYGRAVLRAMSSGVPEIAGEIVAYQERMTKLVLAAMRGARGPLSFADLCAAPPQPRELEQIFLLLQIWYATLIGWSAGLLPPDAVDAHLARAISIVLRGAA